MAARPFRAAPVPLTGERLFAWALGAPYHVAHGTFVDGPEDPADPAVKSQVPPTREMLSRDWGVDRPDDLVSRMTRLGNEGHRRTNRERVNRYATMWRPGVAAAREEYLGVMREGGEEAGNAAADLWLLDAVQADRRGIRGSPLLAFDVARGIMLAREGLMLGWLGEEAAFAYVLDAARDARRTYRSWEEYGADFLLSRDVWAGGEERDDYDEIVGRLLSRKDSPWRRVPWEAAGPWATPRPVRPVARDAPLWTLERG